MKKVLGLILSAVLLTSLLAGCAQTTAPESNGEGALGGASAASESQSAQAGEKAATKVYTDQAGREVEIPINPQRVVTINMTAEALALGVKPVGASENWMNNIPEAQKEGIESVGTAKSINFEKIIQLEPDLIITPVQVTDEATVESLSKIAPTVVGPFFGDALENLRTVGELLGKTAEAEAWIQNYQRKTAETKAALSGVIEEGKTALVVQLYTKDATYIYPASTWPTIYTVLGLQQPDAPELKELATGSQLSLEKLTEYDPDYIFLTSVDDSSMPELTQEFTKNTVWNTLSAVKNNRVYTMGSRLSAGDVLTLEWALEEVVQAVQQVD